jgi:hypothetical protein
MIDDYYWELELWDKEIIKVKPHLENIKYIQDMMAKGSGSIMFPNRSIPVKNIKDFRLSDELYSSQKLIEAVNTIFNEPTITKRGVKAQWVKKSVPRRVYDKHYAHIPAYRLLDNNDSFVTIAYLLPTNQIDHQLVQDLTPDDDLRLARRI